MMVSVGWARRAAPAARQQTARLSTAWDPHMDGRAIKALASQELGGTSRRRPPRRFAAAPDQSSGASAVRRRRPVRDALDDFEPRPRSEVASRLLNCVMSIAMLLVAAPIMLLTAALVRLTSRGPVL